MKRFISLLLILCLPLGLCACGDEAVSDNTVPPTQISPTPEPEILPLPSPNGNPSPTPSATPELTPETSPEQTAEPTPTPVPVPTSTPDGGYIEILRNPAQGIYEGPSYDCGKVGIILQATGYTIMEEQTDDEGNLWGRLKSGIGWVDLTSARAFEGVPPLLTANYVDMNRVGSSYREFYPLEDSEYSVLTDVRVTAPVTDIELVMLEPFDYTVTESYGVFGSLNTMEPLLTRLIFWGDFTTYGISLTDEQGNERLFAITMSGRNGELVVYEVDLNS